MHYLRKYLRKLDTMPENVYCSAVSLEILPGELVWYLGMKTY